MTQNDPSPVQNDAPKRFWAAAFYFLAFSAIAALFPYLTLFYEHLNFTGSQIGMLTAIGPIVTLFATPLWTGIADATRRHRAILITTCFLAIGLVLSLSRMTTLVWVAVVFGTFSFIAAPILPLVDNGTMHMLKGKKESYGRIRLWATIGWAVTSPIIGQLIESDGLRWAFYGYSITLGLGLIAAHRLSVAQENASLPFWHGVRKLVSNRRWVLFLAMVFIGGMGFAAVNNYLFLYMDRMAASKTLMGVSQTISTLSELPVMFFAGWFLRRFKARGLLIISLVFLAARLLLYSVVDVPWAVLLVQLLHGPTFPLLWVAGVSYADEIAPPGLGATAQGMFSGTLSGLGSAVGAFLGGVLFTSLGAWGTFRTFGLVTLISVIGFILLEGYILIRHSQK